MSAALSAGDAEPMATPADNAALILPTGLLDAIVFTHSTYSIAFRHPRQGYNQESTDTRIIDTKKVKP